MSFSDLLQLVSFLWRWHLITGILRLTKEERTAYIALLKTNGEVLEALEELQRTRPNSTVLNNLLNLHARPFLGRPETGAPQDELATQDALWAHIHNVAEVLTRFRWDRWDSETVALFSLESDLVRHGSATPDYCIRQLREYEEQLIFMVGHGALKGVRRKLDVLQAWRDRLKTT